MRSKVCGSELWDLPMEVWLSEHSTGVFGGELMSWFRPDVNGWVVAGTAQRQTWCVAGTGGERTAKQLWLLQDACKSHAERPWQIVVKRSPLHTDIFLFHLFEWKRPQTPADEECATLKSHDKKCVTHSPPPCYPPLRNSLADTAHHPKHVNTAVASMFHLRRALCCPKQSGS